jgi:SAM-dependent methyltransferase
MEDKNKILNLVNSYYSQKVIKYGSTPRGVDWNSKESQEIRFQQLINVINRFESFSLLDFGSGYGALYSFLKANGIIDFSYTGYDISVEMTNKGKELLGENDSLNWLNKMKYGNNYDYTIASGIFNVKMKIDEKDWENYIQNALNQINKVTTKGFSFNMLTTYSDEEFINGNLHYANPEKIFSYCKQNFSHQVALLHDYNLYEFTILVRK